jgi:hypothetical protein
MLEMDLAIRGVRYSGDRPFHESQSSPQHADQVCSIAEPLHRVNH